MKAYVISYDFSQNARAMQLLSAIADDVTFRKEQSRPGKSELMELVTQYDIMVIGVKEKMDDEIFEKASRLKYLCTLSIGLDHIGKKFLTSNTVKVISCMAANVSTVAEFALAYMLSDLKDFAACHESFAIGTERAGLPHLPYEASDATIGIIGAGKIATRLFELAAPFGFKKLCWTFNPEKHKDLAALGVTFTGIAGLCAASDYILPLLPYSQETHHILGSGAMASAKKQAIIINVARTNLMDIRAFRDFVLKGYFKNSLIDCSAGEIDQNVIPDIIPFVKFSPHVAGISEASLVRMGVEIMEKLTEAIAIAKAPAPQ